LYPNPDSDSVGPLYI